MRITPILLLLLFVAACDSGSKDQGPAADVVPAEDSIPGEDTASVGDSTEPPLDTVIAPEDTLAPPEDVLHQDFGPEDTLAPPEDVLHQDFGPEDTLAPPEDVLHQDFGPEGPPTEDTLVPPEDTPCVPDCDGIECGDDGCGGACGTCGGPQDLCVDGLCLCQPLCDGLECGDDGCGGACGACEGPQDLCVDGLCACQPLCETPGGDPLECGPDGCGGVCGECVAPDTCDGETGLCVCDCTGAAPSPVCDEATGMTWEHGCAAICAGVADFVPGPCSQSCIIEEGPAIEVGDPVPAFSCPDLNPSSPLYGQMVTPALLGEQIWIAYFGSCT